MEKIKNAISAMDGATLLKFYDSYFNQLATPKSANIETIVKNADILAMLRNELLTRLNGGI